MITRDQVLVIGERLCVRPGTAFHDALLVGGACIDVDKWASVSERLGAFGSRGRPNARLTAIGLDLTRAMNLLPPATSAERWDARGAALVAGRTLALPTTRAVVMVGRRVARALVAPARWPFYHHGALTVDGRSSTIPALLVPHPSGLNRLWNDETEIDVAREVVEEWYAVLMTA